MNKAKKAAVAVLCIAAVGGGSVYGIARYKKSRIENTVVDVVPLSLLAQPAEWFNYDYMPNEGQINSANVQRVTLDTDKLVKEVCVKKGQTVKKGDVILEYDMTVVELQLAQKENQVTLTEQDIKRANRELEALRRARPSEDQPSEPDYPDYPDNPDFPDDPGFHDDPEIPDEPVRTVDEVTGGFHAVSGSGAPYDPYIINCNPDTLVRKQFAMALAGSGRFAELHVYDENSVFLYKWIVSGASYDPASAEDWHVTDGLLIDSETGTVSIDPAGKMHGQLSFTVPQAQTGQDEWFSDHEITGNGPGDEMDFGGNDFGGTDFYGGADYGSSEESYDYMYTRKELAQKITEKQNEIKGLNLDLRSAQLAVETARKQKIDGRVIAEIDGVVKKIGTAAGDDADDEEDEKEKEYDPYAEPDADDGAFAVIEGKGSKEVAFNVTEMNLDSYTIGTELNVMSYESGSGCTAEVTSVDDIPVSYGGAWGGNPNSSTYRVHAALSDGEDFSINEWVTVSADGSSPGGESTSNSVYLPIHYVRQEGGDYYVLKQGGDGRLVKQYVRAGKIMWGTMLEITGGLDMKDKICFPFGKNVREGAKTNETTEILMPKNYY